jgi:hypothetical protein
MSAGTGLGACRATLAGAAERSIPVIATLAGGFDHLRSRGATASEPHVTLSATPDEFAGFEAEHGPFLPADGEG